MLKSSNCPPVANKTRYLPEVQPFSLLPIIPKISEHTENYNFQFLLLHKDVPKGLYVLAGKVVSTGCYSRRIL